MEDEINTASLKVLLNQHIDFLFTVMTIELGSEMDHENLAKFLEGQAN